MVSTVCGQRNKKQAPSPVGVIESSLRASTLPSHLRVYPQGETPHRDFTFCSLPPLMIFLEG